MEETVMGKLLTQWQTGVLVLLATINIIINAEMVATSYSFGLVLLKENKYTW